MLNLAAATIFLGLEPTDMRKSFDTLAARVRGAAPRERRGAAGRTPSRSARGLPGTFGHATELSENLNLGKV